MGILKIQDVCKEKGLTMQDLSKRLDISYQAMYASVSGNPTMERLQQIADALGVHITELFESKGDFVAFVHHEGETRHFNSPDSLAQYIRPMCKVIEK